MMNLALFSCLALLGVDAASRRTIGYQGRRPKNIIIMIPDGCDEAIQYVARLYKGEPLAVDQMGGGALIPSMANSLIPGSAAAGTALSTGYKTTIGFVGVAPRTDDMLPTFDPNDFPMPYSPMANVFEGARLEGKAGGLVSTSSVTHATPASYSAHIQSRGQANDIMEHIIHNKVDVVMGGGKQFLMPGEGCPNFVAGGVRTDCEDLRETLMERDFVYCETRDELMSLNVTHGKAFCTFAANGMDADIDRAMFNPHEPSLAEMTAKAIEILSQNEEGFILMVEGSQVDWAGHNNDPVWMVTDFLAFDEAVHVALDFAKDNDETLVIGFPDHNTGGLKVGHYDQDFAYDTSTADVVEVLKKMEITASSVVNMMTNSSDDANLVATVSQYWHIDMDAEAVAELRAFEENGLSTSYALARTVSRRYTEIGWTTHGHTGETVPIWWYGDFPPFYTVDNTEIAWIIADAFKFNLDDVTDYLFNDLDFANVSYTIDLSDAENPVVVCGACSFPVSKDYAICNDQTMILDGLTVHAPATNKVYLSKVGISLCQLA